MFLHQDNEIQLTAHPFWMYETRVFAIKHTQHKKRHEKKERRNCNTHTVDGQVPYKLTAANQSRLTNVEYGISTNNRYTTGKGLLKVKVCTENWL